MFAVGRKKKGAEEKTEDKQQVELEPCLSENHSVLNTKLDPEKNHVGLFLTVSFSTDPEEESQQLPPEGYKQIFFPNTFFLDLLTTTLKTQECELK